MIKKKWKLEIVLICILKSFIYNILHKFHFHPSLQVTFLKLFSVRKKFHFKKILLGHHSQYVIVKIQFPKIEVKKKKKINRSSVNKRRYSNLHFNLFENKILNMSKIKVQ